MFKSAIKVRLIGNSKCARIIFFFPLFHVILFFFIVSIQFLSDVREISIFAHSQQCWSSSRSSRLRYSDCGCSWDFFQRRVSTQADNPSMSFNQYWLCLSLSLTHTRAWAGNILNDICWTIKKNFIHTLKSSQTFC